MNLLQPVLSDVSELWDLSAVRPEKNKLNKKLSQPSFPNLCVIVCHKKIISAFLFFFLFFLFPPFSLLLLNNFPFLSLDSWRESRWLLFLWLHTECNAGRLVDGFPSSQTQWWQGAICVGGAEGFLWTEMAEAMTVWELRVSCLFILPLWTSKPSASLPLCYLLSRASLFRLVPPHKARMSLHSSLLGGFSWWLVLINCF